MLNYKILNIEQIWFHDFQVNVKYLLKKIIILVLISILVGLFLLIIGIGGIQFYIPMLLILGYQPFVASSTSVFLIMNASFANAIIYTIKGEINVYNQIWYGMWTAARVFIGVTLLNIVIKKPERFNIFIYLGFRVDSFLSICSFI